MKWNAFNIVSPAIEKTKQRLFPFDFKEWVKLAVISALSGVGGGGGGNGGGRGFSSGEKLGDTGTAAQAIRDKIKAYWWVGGILFLIMFVFITLFTYIRSVFTFIFVESLINKKSKFTFRKNNSKGISLFLFNFVITIITMLLIAGLASPYIYNFMKGNPIISAGGIAYLIVSIASIIFYFIILWVLYLFLKDFVVPYMYSKNIPTFFALKQVWKNILKNKSEIFVYWIARLLLGIGIAIISIMIFIILLLAFIILGGIIFLIGLLVYKITSGSLIIIVSGIIIGFILFLALIFSMVMAALPLTVFYRYFQLMNFEKLTNIRLLKKF